MSKEIIKIDKIGKRYQLGEQHIRYDTFLAQVISWLKFPFRKYRELRNLVKQTENGYGMDFWALKNISFNVSEGEVVGIIGKNGAGKSTLLKILSRITDPTEGQVELYGRVSSLLEVGTGFHKDLSGRENIYMNGTILGMTKKEIDKKFDEIVAFSGIEKFIDTPIKRYSSGMNVRLAFAVAAHLEPEILIIDEVLAVGDAEFQKKCLGKMQDVARHGRTVLFVSHNMEAVQNLCTRAILLKDGQIISQGETADVVHEYLKEYSTAHTLNEWTLENAPGNEDIKLLMASVYPATPNDNGVIRISTPFVFEFQFANRMVGTNNLCVNYHLMDERGILVYVAFSEELDCVGGVVQAKCEVPGDLLNAGTYTIARLIFLKDKGTSLFEYKDAITFEILNNDTGHMGWMGKKEGVIKPKLNWQISQKPLLK